MSDPLAAGSRNHEPGDRQYLSPHQPPGASLAADGFICRLLAVPSSLFTIVVLLPPFFVTGIQTKVSQMEKHMRLLLGVQQHSPKAANHTTQDAVVTMLVDPAAPAAQFNYLAYFAKSAPVS